MGNGIKILFHNDVSLQYTSYATQQFSMCVCVVFLQENARGTKQFHSHVWKHVVQSSYIGITVYIILLCWYKQSQPACCWAMEILVIPQHVHSFPLFFSY